MAILRKVTRLLYKTLKYVFILLVLLVTFLIIAVNTESFQTWLAQKTAAYYSKEWGVNVSVDKVKLAFVTRAELENFFIEDEYHDTLLFSKHMEARLSGFNYRMRRLRIDQVELHNTKANLIRYKNKERINLQFLIDYFASSDSTVSKNPWKIDYGKLTFRNVDFRYRDENKNTTLTQNINYNNLYLTGTSGEISDIDITHDTVYAKISNLKGKEQSGFVLENLSGIAKIGPKGIMVRNLFLQTPTSLIAGGLFFQSESWEDYNDFINKIRIRANLNHKTKIDFKDISYFAKELNGLDKVILFEGKLNGYVSDFIAEDVIMEYEGNTRFVGDLSMSGLPNISSTYLHFDVEDLSTSRADLEKTPSYPFTEGKHLKVPADLAKFGVVSYRGKFDGFINDFTTYGKFKTSLGNVSTDLGIQVDTAKNIIKYHGKIKTESFNVGSLIGNKEFGSVALNCEIKGKGVTIKEIDAQLKGTISNLSFNSYTYHDITINGDIRNKIFNGRLVAHDENADFDFDGKVDFTHKIPDIDFISTVNKINLSKLGFVKTMDGYLSSQILINLKGDNIDNITGLVNFDNSVYKTEEKTFKLSTFDLQLDQDSVYKTIRLTSNYLNALMQGRFNLTTINGSFNTFLSYYYPTFIAKNKGKFVYEDEFTFKITIKKFNAINELLYKDFMISPNSVVAGRFDVSKRLLNVQATADTVKYKSIKMHGSHLFVYTQDNDVYLKMSGKSIDLTDSMRFSSFILNLHSKDKDTDYNFSWDNNASPKYGGVLKGGFAFDKRSVILTYDKIDVTIGDSTWNMITSNPSMIDSSGTVKVDPLVFKCNQQMINIQGNLSNRPSDKLDFNLQNFELYQLNPLLAAINLNIKGIVNGTFSLHNKVKNLAFSSDLGFLGLRINDNPLGDGQLKTEYNTADKYLFVDGYTSFGFENPFGEKLRNLSFSGYYYLEKKEESLDISIDANPASLALLNPIVKGIFTIKSGLVTGQGKLTGTPNKPKLDGKFKLAKCELMVDYLNVTYSLLGNIEIFSDQIRFEDVKMSSEGGKKNSYGIINGNIFHNNFKDMRIDFDINYNNLLVLNTLPKQNPDFYGKAFATGNTGIYGFINDVKLDINARTEKGTVLNIPLDGPAEVSDNNFIRFVSKDTVKAKKDEEKHSAFSLDMNVNATQDAEIQIIFDAKSGDVIKARGNGEIGLKINNRGKFDMFGEYKLVSGEYLFTLENFITKKFEIEKGSTIVWGGSPYNADIDIVANYKQRSSLGPLFPHDSTGKYKRRVPVNCKLYMKDKLMSPAISFGVELPTIDDNTRSQVQSILNDEAEVNRQVFSLLLLKSFVTPLQYSQGGGISAGSAFAANSSEMLSNRISGWLSGLTNEVDIGVNYRPGTELSSDELDIALSKQLLNNRLSLESNLGVGTPQSKNQSGLIGDVNIEYKLTDDGRYRVKGFNRSNDNTQVATSGGPFTQGVGAFYREEFESWDDLYARYVKKLKSIRGKKAKKTEPSPEAKKEEPISIGSDENN